MRTQPCMCGDPACPSCGPAQGYPLNWSGDEPATYHFFTGTHVVELTVGDNIQVRTAETDIANNITSAWCTPNRTQRMHALEEAVRQLLAAADFVEAPVRRTGGEAA